MYENGLTVVGLEWEFAVADDFLGHDAGYFLLEGYRGFLEYVTLRMD